MKNETHILKDSKQNVSDSILANASSTEKEKFTAIIQTHHNYLVELKQQKSSRLLREHRNKILQHCNGQLYMAFLERTINYKVFRELRNYLIDMLSWEAITGVKQLSIFDDVLPLIDETHE